MTKSGRSLLCVLSDARLFERYGTHLNGGVLAQQSGDMDILQSRNGLSVDVSDQVPWFQSSLRCWPIFVY